MATQAKGQPTGGKVVNPTGRQRGTGPSRTSAPTQAKQGQGKQTTTRKPATSKPVTTTRTTTSKPANGNGKPNGNGRSAQITTTDDMGQPGYTTPVTLVVRWKIDQDGTISNRVIDVIVRGKQVALDRFAATVAKASGDTEVDDLTEWVKVAKPKARANHRATLTAYVTRQGFTITANR